MSHVGLRRVNSGHVGERHQAEAAVLKQSSVSSLSSTLLCIRTQFHGSGPARSCNHDGCHRTPWTTAAPHQRRRPYRGAPVCRPWRIRVDGHKQRRRSPFPRAPLRDQHLVWRLHGRNRHGLHRPRQHHQQLPHQHHSYPPAPATTQTAPPLPLLPPLAGWCCARRAHPRSSNVRGRGL